MNYAREKKLAAFKRNTGRRAGSALYRATQEAFERIRLNQAPLEVPSVVREKD